MPLRRTQRLCLNCDNRHGCRTEEPACLRVRRAPDERRLTGRQLMARRAILAQCEGCALFRRCWRAQDYRIALRSAPSPSAPADAIDVTD